MLPVLQTLRGAAREVTASSLPTLLVGPIGNVLLSWGALAWWFGSAGKAEVAVFPADLVLRLREAV